MLISDVFRLNIFYLILEKLNTFAEEAKFDVSDLSGPGILSEYEEKRTDAWRTIENLNIIKRIISVCTSIVVRSTGLSINSHSLFHFRSENGTSCSGQQRERRYI
jgi:amphiphysin